MCLGRLLVAGLVLAGSGCMRYGFTTAASSEGGPADQRASEPRSDLGDLSGDLPLGDRSALDQNGGPDRSPDRAAGDQSSADRGKDLSPDRRKDLSSDRAKDLSPDRRKDLSPDRARDHSSDKALPCVPADCSDGLSCTNDVCAAGVCSHPLVANTCLISGVCRAAGAVNPSDPCSRCWPATATDRWSGISGCVTTLAGTGATGATNGPVASATFNVPDSIAVSSTGTIYVSDKGNNCIRKISGGQVSTFAGSCTSTGGYANGSLTAARFSYPSGLDLDGSGNIYLADAGNRVVRLISGGQVTTLAGSGNTGFLDGAAASAQFNFPTDLAVNSSGRVYVTDLGNHRLRLVFGGQVSTFAGSGTAGFADGTAASAQFNNPDGVTVSSSGAVYVVDRDNHRVRLVSGGQVTTVAGSGTPGFVDGPAASARFLYPRDVAVGSAGQIYVADRYGHRIRVISGGQVSTVAGDGTLGFADGVGTAARFNYPHDVAIDLSGKLLIADTDNARIRVITP